MRKSISSLKAFLRTSFFSQTSKTRVGALRKLRCEPLESRRLLAVYYVDATGGNDSYDGLAGSYSSGSGPWQTIEKVNSVDLAPGDSVLFKRGEVWRERLISDDGSENNWITYADYGNWYDPKPQILGSVEADSTSDWISLGDNIWATVPAVDLVTTTGSELLSNTSFTFGSYGWSASSQSPASSISAGRTGTTYDTWPACYKLTAGSENGDSYDDIVLSTTSGMSITSGEYYQLSFAAKASTAFSLDSIALHENGTSTNSYASSTASDVSITTDWTTYEVLFKATTTETDAVLSFYMGDLLPANATFYIDTVSFKSAEFDARPLSNEVGNIIFNDETAVGVLQTDSDDLEIQGDFWYDTSDWTVKVYSTSNPGSYYSSIELAINGQNLSGGSYATYQNLDLRYFGSHAIHFVNKHDNSVIDCDIAFIGGCHMSYNGVPTRYGNGIEFWDNNYNSLVEGCRIWEVYDTGLTNQSTTNCSQHDITYQNNLLWNCNSFFEFFLGNSSADADDIYFINNTCVNAGGQMTHAQRPSQVDAFSVALGTVVTDDVTDIHIENNVFSGAFNGMISCRAWVDTSGLSLDYNLYDAPTGLYAWWQGEEASAYSYYSHEYSTYLSVSEQDAHSIPAAAHLVDVENQNFHLLSSSPAINSGCTTNASTDIEGFGRPQAGVYDMGAYEYDYALSTQDGLLANWKLDETSGITVADSYGTFEAKNINAVINQDGPVGTAYDFDGVDDYVAIPAMNYDEFTVSGWFYRDTKDTTNADAIFGGWDYWDQTGYDIRFSINNDALEFSLWTQNSSLVRTRGVVSRNLGSASVGEWYYVAATYNSTTGEQVLYVNGEAVSTFSHTAGNTIVPNTNDYMYIGYSSVNVGYFDGKIDDVKVFDHPLLPSEIAQEYQTGSLAAHWTLNEESGSYAYDTSLNGQTGTIVGATMDQDGQVKTAYDFDGVDDCVSVPAMNYDELTISGWFYRDTKDTTNADTIFGGWDYWGQTGYDVRFYINSDALEFSLWTQDNSLVKTRGVVSHNLGSASVGEWYYVAATYNSTTGEQVLYINGEAVSTFSHTAGNTIVPNTNNNMYIGYSSVNSGYFDGKIDDIRVYDRPISAEEVSRDYQNGIMVAHWRLDETSGVKALDSCGNYDGSNSNVTLGQSGQLDTAYDFNGTSSYVTIPAQNYDEFTVSAWFYRDTKDTSNADAIFGGWNYSGQEGFDLRFYTNSDTLEFKLWTQNSSQVKTFGTASYNLGSASVGEWYQVVATYNSTTGEQILYINGEAVSTVSHTAGNTVVPFTANNGKMRIGYSSVNTGYFDGKIDDVRVYNRPLTSTEISRNYEWNGDFTGETAYSTVAGDANNDGRVDGSDVTILAAHWQYGVDDGNASWSMGDFNGDGKVDGSDVTILASNWQTGVDVAVVATSDSKQKTVSRFTPPENALLGIATVPKPSSLLTRGLITPESEPTDKVLTELSWNDSDYTAVAKDLVIVSAKKATTAKDKLFALDFNPYNEPE